MHEPERNQFHFLEAGYQSSSGSAKVHALKLELKCPSKQNSKKDSKIVQLFCDADALKVGWGS